jgi:hypothetical protein
MVQDNFIFNFATLPLHVQHSFQLEKSTFSLTIQQRNTEKLFVPFLLKLDFEGLAHQITIFDEAY